MGSLNYQILSHEGHHLFLVFPPTRATNAEQPTMAPRPEARTRESLAFHPSHHDNDNDDSVDGDDAFGETFALELDALAFL